MKNQNQWNASLTWEMYSNETTSLTWGGVFVEIIDANDELSMEEMETFSVQVDYADDETLIWEPYDKVKRLCFRIPYRKDLYQVYEIE